MESIIKSKEKEMPSVTTQKIFGIIRVKENFQNLVEASVAFSTGEMPKRLLNYKRQAELTRDRVMMLSRCLMRLL